MGEWEVGLVWWEVRWERGRWGWCGDRWAGVVRGVMGEREVWLVWWEV